jgi:ankyrin repeat protein
MVSRLVSTLLVAGFGLACGLTRALTSPPPGPVSRAALIGDLTSLRAQLAAGVDPNTPDGTRASRPLANAARTGKLEAMTVLLDAGADPNLGDAGGNRWIPLMHALHKHQFRSVHLLLERGAKADGPAGLRLTPLMMAVATGQTEAARLLLDRGADPRRRAPDEASLLDIAVAGGALTDIDEPLLGACHTSTVRLLHERVPDLQPTGTVRGRVARIFARLNGCSEVLALLGPVR